MVERMLADNAPADAIVAAVRALERVTLCNVTERYGNADVTRDQTKIRVRNYRKRKKLQQVAKANDVATAGANVTVPAVTVTQTPVEGPTYFLSSLLTSSETEESKKEVVARARATRMPVGAPLTEEFTAAAIELGADRAAIPKIWAEFVDYWCALPGNRGTKLNWLATWRNRLRQIVSKGNPNGKASHALGGFSGLTAQLRRKIAEQEADDDAGGPEPLYRR